jgi:hypothetical protein
MALGDLIIGDRTFNTGLNLKNWRDTGWDATKEYCIPTGQERDVHAKCDDAGPGKEFPYGLPEGAPKYTSRFSTRPTLRGLKTSNGGRNPRYEDVKAVVKQFVIHHDGCMSAEMCFNVVQNERGLSVHFLLDNDGTIYQTIDLGLMAYHAADWNLYSIGVELCNFGDAKQRPNYYDHVTVADQKRAKEVVRINRNPLLAFTYNDAQMKSFAALSRELLKLLPNLPAEYPQSSPGQQSWDTMADANQQRERYAGYVGHYHITAQKWDPGPFDFKQFCSGLRGGKFCYPIFPKGEPKKLKDGPETRPEIPADRSELDQDTKELYKLNEQRADGGFFPVGPWGEQRLWHGGIHLAGKEGSPVFAPFAGRLVAARMGPPSPIGSVNFVLMRHDVALGGQRVQFYSLYMHLLNELTAKPGDKPIAWLESKEWKTTNKAGVVTLLDEPISAGAVIGRVGTAGPEAVSRGQLHVEFFSVGQLFEGKGEWTLVDGSASGRFCDSKLVNDAIDTNKDKILQREELKEFYAGGSQEDMRKLVTLHISEWTAEPSWVDELAIPKDFKKLKRSELEAMVAEQITPGLWWDARVARHCRLPVEGIVYHYHPVYFVSWFNQQLIEAAINAPKTKLAESDAKDIPPGITDDLGDKAGTSMRSAAEGTDDACNEKLTLQELVKGFAAPECGP